LNLDVSPPSQGFGITLEIEDTEISDIWYKDLTLNRRFTVCKGKDGTGNVYIPENLVSVRDDITTQGKKIDIVVADGGFEIKKYNGKHMENFQELFSGQVILSELLLTMMVLEPGGHFVCKLFDTFSHLTSSLIYVTTQIFKQVFIVKPLRSRIVNSERYLIGKGFHKSENFEFLVRVMSNLHRKCKETNERNKQSDWVIPESLVPIDIMKQDSQFMDSLRKMNILISEKQTKALNLVMDNI